MALTFGFTLQGDSGTAIDATDKIQVSGGAFDDPIEVGSYQDGTHIETSGGADKSSADNPKNSKYLTSSTVDIGGGSVALSSVATADCPLKIVVSDASAFAITSSRLWAYDNSVDANPPEDITIKVAQQGDSAWSTPAGSGSAMDCGASGSATSHTFYFMLSATPTSAVAIANAAIKFEATYSA